VEVVIGFEERRMCWRDKGRKQGARWKWCRLKEKMVNQGAEESNLVVVRY
jgi:hypothetical protein